jgi:hypothetical protein
VSIGALALLAAGCGAESHPNEPRPAVASRVSITVTDKAITVSPGKIGMGPEKSQQIPQNENEAQPPIKTDAPLDVVFVVANQTQREALVEVRGPDGNILFTSGKIPPTSPATFPTELPTASYVLAAAGIPHEPFTKLVVGPYRASSENDVLLP